MRFASKSKLFFTAVLILFGAFAGGVNGALITSENLDDNLVPSGWTLSPTGNSGITNGRLEAYSVNGSGVLAYALSNVSELTLEYDGSFIDNQWGSYSLIDIQGLPLEFYHGTNRASHGNNNFASVGGVLELNPVDTSDFHYEISVTAGLATFRGVNSSMVEEFNISYMNASIDPSLITGVSFRAHHTVDAGVTWIDNLNISAEELSSVPEPSSIILLGLAGLGLTALRRRTRILDRTSLGSVA